MNARTTYGAVFVLAVTVTSAAAQVSKTIPGDSKVVTATVEAIERASRDVTVKKADGTFEVIHVPKAIKRFDVLKIGDTITARYYETVVLRVKAQGEKDLDTATSAVVPSPSGPAGTASRQQTITATITAIDPNVPSISFTGPRGWTYSSRVEDKKALATVKVGDKVDIIWTEAILVSIDDAK
jgi:hypothetical protein